MSATLGGAFKAALESKGLGIAFYRDEAPPGTDLPYGIVTELPAVSEPAGDFGDPDGVDVEVRQQVQIDVWQAWRTPAGAVAEDRLLAGRVAAVCRGLRILETVGVGRCYPAVLRTWQPVREGQPLSGDNLVRDIITVEVLRTLTGHAPAPVGP